MGHPAKQPELLIRRITHLERGPRYLVTRDRPQCSCVHHTAGLTKMGKCPEKDLKNHGPGIYKDEFFSLSQHTWKPRRPLRMGESNPLRGQWAIGKNKKDMKYMSGDLHRTFDSVGIARPSICLVNCLSRAGVILTTCRFLDVPLLSSQTLILTAPSPPPSRQPSLGLT